MLSSSCKNRFKPDLVAQDPCWWLMIRTGGRFLRLAGSTLFRIVRNARCNSHHRRWRKYGEQLPKHAEKPKTSRLFWARCCNRVFHLV